MLRHCVTTVRPTDASYRLHGKQISLLLRIRAGRLGVCVTILLFPFAFRILLRGLTDVVIFMLVTCAVHICNADIQIKRPVGRDRVVCIATRFIVFVVGGGGAEAANPENCYVRTILR
jgi:hypothetical protein